MKIQLIALFACFCAVSPVSAKPLFEITISQNPYRSIEIIRQDEVTKNYLIVYSRIDIIESKPVKFNRNDNPIWVDCKRKIFKPMVSIVNDKNHDKDVAWLAITAGGELEPEIWFKYVCP